MGQYSCANRLNDKWGQFLSVAEKNEKNLKINASMDRKVICNQIIKNYQFNAKEHNNNKKEVYEYEVVYLVNTLTPRVGAVLTEEQLSELQIVQKLNYEIKSSKATIVR